MSINSKAKRDSKLRKKKGYCPPSPSERMVKTIMSERVEYVDQWAGANAPNFQKRGDYSWMADFISGYKTLLEVGSGDGCATVELAKRGHRIVSIDENPIILDAAEKNLASNGIICKRLKREVIKANADSYKIAYNPIPLDNFDDSVQVLLIEGDINNDPNLFSWLHSLTPFDGVICWLVGTHGARALNEVIDLDVTPTPMHYRLIVQNRVYEVSEVLLRSGGILNIVDRAEVPDRDEIREDFLNAHRDQASVTCLVVEDLKYRIYEETEADNKVEMCITTPLSGREPKFDKMALISVTSHKP